MIPDSLRLVAITDDVRDGAEGLVARATAAVRGGATMVQLRLQDVDARDLARLARMLVTTLPVPVIVTDRADLALAAGASGVYVSTDDIPASALRRVVPSGFLIGASVGNDTELPVAHGADYVGIGPVFAATSSAGLPAMGVGEFARLARLTGLPAIGIGGINGQNARELRDAGAAGVAAIRSIFAAPDPEAAARALWSATGS